MEQLEIKLNSIVAEGLIKAVLSSVRKNIEESYFKIEVKPIVLKETLYFHASYYYEKKVTHENIEVCDFTAWLVEKFERQFKQGMIFTKQQNYQVLVSKKGKATILKQAPTMSIAEIDYTHDRKKQYILAEGSPIDFLVHLGVMDAQGKVYKKKYDKFRQLNKYLEFVSDAMERFEGKSKLTIIDFGCGKAYLTFALYHYLVKEKGYDVEIIGLDLKEDVIAFCNTVAETLSYKGLVFKKGDIRDFEFVGNVDMVVSLHACDTATDAAIGKAVMWDAGVIFAVPCCQHELFDMMESDVLAPLLKHGIVKDKLATIVTDTLRSTALEVIGYDVQMLEFIDMTHTPKNILIRAYKRPDLSPVEGSASAYTKLRDFWNVSPSIEKTIGERLINRL